MLLAANLEPAEAEKIFSTKTLPIESMVSTQGSTSVSLGYRQANVSFDDFKLIMAKVEPHRASRLIDLNAFLELSGQPDVIILDTRSTFRYEQIHLKGARHLALTDFTEGNLAKAIPSFDTAILIYCNNNFGGNHFDSDAPITESYRKMNPTLVSQMDAQATPKMMALNLPTYASLYGYGYRNVYELNELVDLGDRRIKFEGTMVGWKRVAPRWPLSLIAGLVLLLAGIAGFWKLTGDASKVSPGSASPSLRKLSFKTRRDLTLLLVISGLLLSVCGVSTLDKMPSPSPTASVER